MGDEEGEEEKANAAGGVADDPEGPTKPAAATMTAAERRSGRGEVVAIVVVARRTPLWYLWNAVRRFLGGELIIKPVSGSSRKGMMTNDDDAREREAEWRPIIIWRSLGWVLLFFSIVR